MHSAICRQLGPPVSAQLNTDPLVHLVGVPIRPLPAAVANAIYISGSHAHRFLCRYINDTAVEPALPACVAIEMPKFDPSQVNGAGAPRERNQQQPPSTLVAGMASLAVLSAVAVAAVAGRVMLRRGQPRRAEPGAGQRSHEMHSLLHHQRQRRTSSVAGSSSRERSAAGEGGSPLLPGSRGQERLAALLHAELGSQQQRGIEMLPLEALPAALAHQLGSLRKATKSAGAARAAASRAAAAAREAPAAAAAAAARAADVANWVPAEAHQLLSAQNAGEIGLEVPPGVNQAGGAPSINEGDDGSAPPLSRQWGLPTDSLQVSPGHMEVSTHLQRSMPTLTVTNTFFP